MEVGVVRIAGVPVEASNGAGDRVAPYIRVVGAQVRTSYKAGGRGEQLPSCRKKMCLTISWKIWVAVLAISFEVVEVHKGHHQPVEADGPVAEAYHSLVVCRLATSP